MMCMLMYDLNIDSVMIKLPNMTVAEAWNCCLKLETYFGTHVFLDENIILEAEKVYWPYLLCNVKKRYVGRMFENSKTLDFTIDTKGVEMKRRDCTLLLKLWMQLVLATIMPDDVTKDVSLEVTRHDLLSVLINLCVDLIEDKFSMDHYILSKTAKANYKGKSLPEHMKIYNLRNKRVSSGELKVDKYNVGDRVEYIIYHNPNASKVSDKVEDPAYIRQTGKAIIIDRCHYFKAVRNALGKLICFHIPNYELLFDAVAGEVMRSQENMNNITGYVMVTGTMSPRTRLTKLRPMLLKPIADLPFAKKSKSSAHKSSSSKPKTKSIASYFKPLNPAFAKHN